MNSPTPSVPPSSSPCSADSLQAEELLRLASACPPEELASLLATLTPQEQAQWRRAAAGLDPRREAILGALEAARTPSTRSRFVSSLKTVYRLTVEENPWLAGLTPTAKQQSFLLAPEQEVLFGGAAGPGKSFALLLAALQFVDVPGYSALLLRRTFTDLALPGALIPMSHEMLGGKGASWNGTDHRWTFPSGATLSFGYLDTDAAKYRYQSSAFSFVGYDELSQFTEQQYTYLFSRLRRLETSPVPLRMRAASNPGGQGHQWVKERFLGPPVQGRLFIPARLDDNPYLDRERYVASLANLDPVTRARLLAGDWDVAEGGMFRREWFGLVDAVPANVQRVRAWDFAATEAKPGTDPDWTVGLLMGRQGPLFYVLDVRRVRSTPAGVESLVKQTAVEDGTGVPVVIEQEPGSAGVALVASYVRALAGWAVRGVRPTGPKSTRAAPLASQAEAGNVKLLRGEWNRAFLDELELFPGGAKDDQVDGASSAFAHLTAVSVSGAPRAHGGVHVPGAAPRQPALPQGAGGPRLVPGSDGGVRMPGGRF